MKTGPESIWLPGRISRTGIAVLEERIAGLRDSLGRIEALRSELATREAELKALESGQQLAELEAGIREDLLDNKEA
jgi:hypothetical protein